MTGKNHCSCWEEHCHFPGAQLTLSCPHPHTCTGVQTASLQTGCGNWFSWKLSFLWQIFFPRWGYRLTSPLVELAEQILSGRNKQAEMRAETAAWMNAGLNWLWHLSFSLVCISRNGLLMCSKYSTPWEARNWHYGMWEYSWLLKRLRHRHASKSASVGVQWYFWLTLN